MKIYFHGCFIMMKTCDCSSLGAECKICWQGVFLFPKLKKKVSFMSTQPATQSITQQINPTDRSSKTALDQWGPPYLTVGVTDHTTHSHIHTRIYAEKKCYVDEQWQIPTSDWGGFLDNKEGFQTSKRRFPNTRIYQNTLFFKKCSGVGRGNPNPPPGSATDKCLGILV